jgi:phosphoribosylformylglycinamidine synthase subunit PurS
MKARIRITLKNGVLDPQGKAIQNALGSLGFGGVQEVRMCKELLANTVIEDYAFELAKA